MFLFRKPAPERPVTLASLDERVRRIEGLLAACDVRGNRDESCVPKSVQRALAKLAKAGGFNFPHQDSG
jgi:hypothetical protein